MRGLAVPVARSKAAVLAIGGCTVAITGWYWYARTFSADPVRFAKDPEGVFRLMTKTDLLRLRVAEAEVALEDEPSNEALKERLRRWRSALEAERARLKAAGVELKGSDVPMSAPPELRDTLKLAWSKMQGEEGAMETQRSQLQRSALPHDLPPLAPGGEGTGIIDQRPPAADDDDVNL